MNIMDDSKLKTFRAEPPHTNRGVDNNRTLTNISCDWLTITVPSAWCPSMVSQSIHERDGHPTDGFGNSEERIVKGGKAWRRWNPRQPMKHLGIEYESWVYNGPHATPAAHQLHLIEQTRPSRIDVAFDFSCHESELAEQIIDETYDHFRKKKMKSGVSGHGGINTCYIGSPSSLRRLRIYRKDLQDEAYAKLHGPTMRLEVQIKGEIAHAAWRACRSGGVKKLYSIAAAHLADMTGIEAFPDLDDIPEIVPVEAAKPAARLATNIKQNAAWLWAIREAGIDLNDLVDIHTQQMSRPSISRMEARKNDILRADVEHVQSMARLILIEEGQI